MLNFLFNLFLFLGFIICMFQVFHCAKTTYKVFRKLINKNNRKMKIKLTYASLMILFGLGTLFFVDLGFFLLFEIN